MLETAFVQTQQFMNAWVKLGQSQLTQLQSQMAQMQSLGEQLHGDAVTRTMQGVDESARLVKATIGYSNQLGEQWRKITLDAMKDTQAAFAPKA